jgi:hypothetical protein
MMKASDQGTTHTTAGHQKLFPQKLALNIGTDIFHAIVLHHLGRLKKGNEISSSRVVPRTEMDGKFQGAGSREYNFYNRMKSTD